MIRGVDALIWVMACVGLVGAGVRSVSPAVPDDATMLKSARVSIAGLARPGDKAAVHPGEDIKWARPLFSAGGASAADVTGGIAKAEDAKAAALPILVGVIADSNHRVAVFAYGGQTHRVQRNQTIGVWTLVKIETRAAVLARGGETHHLFLDPATRTVDVGNGH